MVKNKVVVSLLFFALSFEVHSFVTNQSADTVLGHKYLVHGVSDDNDAKPNSLSSPRGVYVNGGKLFVADRSNSRVLIYNSVPTSDNTSPDVVIGQPDLLANKTNQGQSKPSANTLYYPNNLTIYGSKLLIADTNNNRVLIYNSIPTSNNASADIVIGQPNLSTGAANQLGTEPVVSSNTLYLPMDLHVDSNGKLYIADYGNNRVLIYNSIPTSNNIPADVVIGQPHMSTNAANQTGTEPIPSSNTLRNPLDVLVAANKLFVSDYSNHRVLVYDPIPSVNNSSASVVIGQSSMTGVAADQGGVDPSSWTLQNPWGLVSDGTNLLIADTSNNRVLIFPTIPATNNSTATYVIGQVFMSSQSANQGGSIAASTLNFPAYIHLSGGKLFASDQSNNRVLIFNSVPTANNQSADVVVGQPGMTNTDQRKAQNANQSGPNASSLDDPRHIWSDGTKLVVSDSANNRVLIWNSISSLTNGKVADVVLGQTTSTDSAINAGGGASGANSTTLYYPYGVSISANKLFVADANNNRVLIYDPIPTAIFSSASYVVGQPDFYTESSGSTMFKLEAPRGIFTDGNKLWVADFGNHRIQVYNPVPGPGVSVTTTTIGTGASGSTANQLSQPAAIFGYGNKLFVVDYGNHRVLVCTSTSTAHMPDGGVAVSTVVIGQADFGQGSANAGIGAPAAWTLSEPTGVFSDGTKLWIADRGNHRVLQFDSIPAVHGASASVVFGQADFTSQTANYGSLAVYGVSANSLSQPNGVFKQGDKLYITEVGNNRALVFTDQGTASAPSSSPTNLTGTALGVSSITWTWDALSNAYHKVVSSTGAVISTNTLVANTSYYTETNLSTNTAYNRSVAVSYSSDFANASTTTAVTKYTLAAPPVSLTVSSVTVNSVVLTWSANTNPSHTRYVIEQSTSTNFTATHISTPVAFGDALTSTTTSISSLMPGATVAFRVSAFNGDGLSSLEFSNLISTITLAPAGFATNVSIANVSSTTATSSVAKDSATAVVIGPNTALPNNSPGGVVLISTSPIETPLVVSTSALASANSNLVSGHYMADGSAREFAFYDQGGRLQTGTFGGNVILFIPYPDTNQDGLLDSNTNVRETKLKFFKLNETTQRWEEQGGTCDTVANNCFIQARSFSVYALIAPLAASNLDSVKVYPTPWQIGSGGRFDASNLTFDNLTNQAKVSVYTILGELVFEKEATGTDGKILWDGKNMKGEQAASGVYLWRATNNSDQEKQGRLAIER